MTDVALANTGAAVPRRPSGWRGIVADWSSDQRAFKNVSWGKAMMWIFLLSDTFIFSCFLLSYMTVRMSTRVPWPNPSKVFALTIGHRCRRRSTVRHHVRRRPLSHGDGHGAHFCNFRWDLCRHL